MASISFWRTTASSKVGAGWVPFLMSLAERWKAWAMVCAASASAPGIILYLAGTGMTWAGWLLPWVPWMVTSAICTMAAGSVMRSEPVVPWIPRQRQGGGAVGQRPAIDGGEQG